MPINNFLLPGAKVTPAYEVANSVRFNGGSSDDLVRTPSSSGNNNKSTLSVWLKRSKVDEEDFIIYGFGGSANRCKITFLDNNKLQINTIVSSSNNLVYETNRLFRDISAWYHIVIAFDSTLGTAGDRVRLYINGTEETSFATETHMGQNTSNFLSTSGTPVYIGSQASGNYFDGYMAEFVFIDGQQLDPTSFGEFDSDSPNIWKPIDVSGLTFGTNGFYLDFENASSLGADVSGNSNNFTVNNLTSVDQSTDTCTNNFATLNFLSGSLSGTTLSEGNLAVANDGNGWRWRPSTIAPSSGKWYAEFKPTSSAPIYTYIGVTPQYVWDTIDGEGIGVGSGLDRTDGGYSVGYEKSGAVYKNAQSQSGSWSSYTTDDIIGVALDLDNHKVYFSKNGTFQNSGDPTSGSTGTGAVSLNTSVGDWSISPSFAGSAVSCNYGSAPYTISSGNTDANGYRNFEYSVPSGYYALNTKNLAEFG